MYKEMRTNAKVRQPASTDATGGRMPNKSVPGAFGDCQVMEGIQYDTITVKMTWKPIKGLISLAWQKMKPSAAKSSLPMICDTPP